MALKIDVVYKYDTQIHKRTYNAELFSVEYELTSQHTRNRNPVVMYDLIMLSSKRKKHIGWSTKHQ